MRYLQLVLYLLLAMGYVIANSDVISSVNSSGSQLVSVPAPPQTSKLTTNIRAFLRFVLSLREKFQGFVKNFFNIGGARGQATTGGECGGSLETNDLIWGGIGVTREEIEGILQMKTARDFHIGVGNSSAPVKKGLFRGRLSRGGRGKTATNPTANAWLSKATDLDFLRFLRRSKGASEDAIKSMIEHAAWRSSKPHGVDNIAKIGPKKFPPDHPLHREVFWLGVSRDNCATLVVRTQAHDGVYYSEDAQEFTDFLVYVLEQGREKYKIGSERQVCLLLDRANFVRPAEHAAGGEAQKVPYKLDMGVVPRLLELFKKLFSTLHLNYPDLLVIAKVVPVSSFFTMCYRVTSRAMDRDSRAKFIMVKERQMKEEIHKMFDKSVLPPHLGGTSHSYGPFELSSIEICNETGSCDGLPTVNPLKDEEE